MTDREDLIEKHLIWISGKKIIDEAIACECADITLAFAKQYHEQQLILNGVGCSKIIASVTYWLWQDSGHAMMDDHRETFTKVVEVEKLTDINELFTNVAKIEVLKQ
tara:strand:+ start:367 stop:687 length:321 start_codon:yes stop_codon:yes gene_type:complete